MTKRKAIALDDEATWPDELLRTLEAGVDALRAFQVEKERIDELQQGDMLLKINPPSNPHRPARDGIIAAVNAQVEDALVVGYHATRLHESEIESIRCSGLRPLDPEHAAQRIRARVEAGNFSAKVGERLLEKHIAQDSATPLDPLSYGSRQNMTWLAFTRNLLRGESGLWRFFTYWGGEAIYWLHIEGKTEEQRDVVRELQRVGTACIVEAAVSVRAIKCDNVGETLAACFLQRGALHPSIEPGLEGYVCEPIPGARVRVITRSDLEFERLTGCDEWQEAIT